MTNDSEYHSQNLVKLAGWKRSKAGIKRNKEKTKDSNNDDDDDDDGDGDDDASCDDDDDDYEKATRRLLSGLEP